MQQPTHVPHVAQRIRESEAREFARMDAERAESDVRYRTFKFLARRLEGRTFADRRELTAFAYRTVVGGERPTDSQRCRIDAALALWAALHEIPAQACIARAS